MNKSFRFLWTLIAVSFLLGCTQKGSNNFSPYKNPPEISIDGNLEDEWGLANSNFNFTFPWQEKSPPATDFYTLNDGQFFYFAFQVEDEDIVLFDFNEESDMARGDRVEVFSAKDPDLENYYSIEMAPNGKILDYKAFYYRQFNNSWDFPENNS
jgi:hypothetical protein